MLRKIMLAVKNERLGWAAFLLSFGVVAAFQLHLVSGTWAITPDSTEYVEGARSIAQGKGYVDRSGDPITLFPPGASLLYAPAALLQRSDYLFFNLIARVLFLAYLAFSYLFLRKSQGWIAALVGFFILSFSIVPLFESTRILSDIPFAFIVVLTLFLFGPERLKDPSAGKIFLLGCLVTVGYFIRTEGVYLFCAYFLYILVAVNKDKKKTLVVFSGIFLAAALFWWIRNIHNQGPSYAVLFQKTPWVMDSGVATAGDWLSRITKNAYGQIEGLGRAFSNRYDSFYWGLALTFLAAGPLFMKKWSYSLFCFILLACYVLVHLTPPGSQDRRLISALPILMLLFLQAFRGFLELFRQLSIRVLISSTLIAVLILSPYWSKGYRFAKELRRRSKPISGEMVIFILNRDFQKLILEQNPRLTARDVVACFHPNVLFYVMNPGAKLTTFLLSEDPEKSYLDLRNKQVTYLYFDRKSALAFRMQAVLDQHGSEFLLVSSNKGGEIYRTQFDDRANL